MATGFSGPSLGTSSSLGTSGKPWGKHFFLKTKQEFQYYVPIKYHFDPFCIFTILYNIIQIWFVILYIYASFDFLRTARIPTACLDGICAITALKVIRTYPFSHSGESMPWICVGTRQSFHTNRGCLCQLEECFFCKAWKSLWKLQHPFGWRRVFENRHGDCRILRDKSACFYLQYLVQNA